MLGARREKKIRQVIKNRQGGVAVVLEDIHDPHNAAAVLRTCDCFGIQEVYFIFEQEAYYNPKQIGKSTSSSANKWLTLKTSRSTATCLGDLKSRGYTLFATALDRESQSIFDIKFKKRKVALIFGNEHRGLSQKALALADEKVRIPMMGMVQSLNLSVSAAVVVFELIRQRRQTGRTFRLPPGEARDLWGQMSSREK